MSSLEVLNISLLIFLFFLTICLVYLLYKLTKFVNLLESEKANRKNGGVNESSS